MIGNPAVANNGNNRLEAFVHGTDNRLWHAYPGGRADRDSGAAGSRSAT